MKMIFIASLLVGPVSGMLLGCGRSSSNTSGNKQSFLPPKDSWYKAPPASLVAKIREKDYLKESEFYVVDPAMQAKAVNLLQNTSSVRLDKVNAALFCGRNGNKRNTKNIVHKGTTRPLAKVCLTEWGCSFSR